MGDAATRTEELGREKYISFTTFRRDGTPVATAVWVVPFEGGLAFTTGGDSGKVKRLARDARATVRVCDRAGRVADGAPVHEGAAIVLRGGDAERVAALVKRKYRTGWFLLSVWEKVQALRGKDDGVADCAIKVTLHD